MKVAGSWFSKSIQQAVLLTSLSTGDMQHVMLLLTPSWTCLCREAWEALGVKDNVSIKRGIELSKRLQRALLRWISSHFRSRIDSSLPLMKHSSVVHCGPGLLFLTH